MRYLEVILVGVFVVVTGIFIKPVNDNWRIFYRVGGDTYLGFMLYFMDVGLILIVSWLILEIINFNMVKR